MPKKLASLYELALSNCSREPIHIPGAIQSFGAVIGCDRTLDKITHVSENILLFVTKDSLNTQLTTALPTDSTDRGANNKLSKEDSSGDESSGEVYELLGRDVSVLLPSDLLHDLRNVCSLPTVTTQREPVGIYQICGQSLDVSVYCTGTSAVIELEKASQGRDRMADSILQVQTVLEQRANVQEMLTTAVQELRYHTGFDRVMAYQFGHDGSGEVVAEARDLMLEPFLGLRYPASDIPEQAKALALKTTLRVIDNVAAPAVPVVALEDFALEDFALEDVALEGVALEDIASEDVSLEARSLDLSLAIARRPSPIHIEYLTNMGVMATMTLAIVVGGELWGLLAFHHRQPKLLSSNFRTMVVLFSQLFSLRFQQVLAEEQFRDRKRTASSLNTIVASQLPDTDWKQTIVAALPQLAKLLSACGSGVVHSGSVLGTFGVVPAQAIICTLTAHSHLSLKNDIVTFDSLEALALVGTDAWGECAGALLIVLNAAESLYAVFFRREVAKEVRWGGNPEKKKVHCDSLGGSFGPRLLPRASFEAYKQTVRGRCAAWNRHDIAVALEIRSELLRLSQNQMQLFQQWQQRLLISELNHRVRNILALIRSVANQTGESATSITAYTQSLEQRITALATAHDFVSGHALEWPTMAHLLTIELKPYSADNIAYKPNESARVELLGPAVGFKASFVPTFVLVLHELASNAAKYGALSTSVGQLVVRWYESKGGLSIHWKETNGPPVTVPQHRGFGMDLIERSIVYEFGGESTLSFEPNGVHVTFWLPSNLVRWQAKSSLPQATEQDRVGPTIAEPTTTAVDKNADKKTGAVLVVEDNMLLATEMERTLRQLGFLQIESAPSVDSAIALIRQRTLTNSLYRVGVLDIDLKQETSFEIAIALQAQAIPFVFVTGHDLENLEMPASLEDIPKLQKPVSLFSLENILHTLIDL